MSSPELQQLTQRVRQLIQCEVSGDTDGWFAVVDPKLRESASAQEADLASFMIRVSSAEVVNVEAVLSPGKSRQGRPVAGVRYSVLYNGASEPTHFSGPWVLDDGEWYTRAVGKMDWGST